MQEHFLGSKKSSFQELFLREEYIRRCIKGTERFCNILWKTVSSKPYVFLISTAARPTI